MCESFIGVPNVPSFNRKYSLKVDLGWKTTLAGYYREDMANPRLKRALKSCETACNKKCKEGGGDLAWLMSSTGFIAILDILAKFWIKFYNEVCLDLAVVNKDNCAAQRIELIFEVFLEIPNIRLPFLRR